MAAILYMHYHRFGAPAICQMRKTHKLIRGLEIEVPDIAVAVLDTFHPQIKSAIRDADIVFVVAARRCRRH
jgi:hypothetical protein